MLAPNAVVALANYFQFYRRQRLAITRVESRMLLWCKSGYGVVNVNGTEYEFKPEDFLFLPWAHAITYQADASVPFLVAGIHLIPDHARGRRLELSVAHDPGDRLARCAWRKDCHLPNLSGVVRGQLYSRSPLAQLAEYIVELFCTGRFSEWQLRHLAQLLIAELAASPGSGVQALNAPPLLEQACRFVSNNLNKSLSLVDLSEHCGCSRSTLTRTFRRCVKMSPVQWIIRSKVDAAARLLSTTALPVGQVGQRVGIEDPYYFSKLFKKARGVTASHWRRKSRLIQ